MTRTPKQLLIEIKSFSDWSDWLNRIFWHAERQKGQRRRNKASMRLSGGCNVTFESLAAGQSVEADWQLHFSKHKI